MSSKNVQATSKQEERKYPKSDSRYWLSRLFRSSYTRDGVTQHVADYCIKLGYGGRRETINLRTANQVSAAGKAAAIYKQLVTEGWDAVLAIHKPRAEKPTRCATVGELLAEVKATAGLRQSTFTVYAQSLRQIVGEIASIGDQPALDENGEPKRDRSKRIVYLSRRDHYNGGRDAWIAKVEAQPLDMLTAEAVQRWKLSYIDKAGTAPDAVRRASNTAATLLRCARSLFSDKALEFARNNLTLPEPLPFDGVKVERRPATRYMSKIDAPSLIARARAELTGEPFKIFVLGLFVGLRKREIDTLLWQQVDFTAAQIRIEATEHLQPKSDDSIGTVDLDPETLALLRTWQAQGKGEFVVAPTAQPQPLRSRSNYRCTTHFQAVYAWLRKQGITALKPLHELRKELGAILASDQGIYAAQSVLRHAHISTTANFYADKKRRITAGLGGLLAPNVTPFATASAPEAPPTNNALRKRRA